MALNVGKNKDCQTCLAGAIRVGCYNGINNGNMSACWLIYTA